MIKKLHYLFTEFLCLKSLVIVFLLIAPAMLGQTTVTKIHTDFGGYWSSSATAISTIQPNTENNLLAFEWNGKTYATGVNNAILDSHSVNYERTSNGAITSFRALKIQSLGYDTSTYFLQGSMIDGSS